MGGRGGGSGIGGGESSKREHVGVGVAEVGGGQGPASLAHRRRWLHAKSTANTRTILGLSRGTVAD